MKRPPVIRDLSGHPVIFAMHICKLVLPQDWVCNPRPRAPRFSGYLHPLPFHDEVHEFFTGGAGTRRVLVENGQLVTKGENLCLQGGTGSKTGGRPERKERQKQRSSWKQPSFHE